MGTLTKVVLSLGTALTALVFFQPYRPVLISGPSMNPTFVDGQFAFVAPMNREPKHGDVVLFDRDGMTLIKRVTMTPGDQYEEVYLPLAHQWVKVTTAAQKHFASRGKNPTRISCIPSGQIYVTGDNPMASLDSRSFGPIPISSIRGFVISSTRR
jgi:signal peptidase I